MHNNIFYRNGQLRNKHDIAAVSSPLGLREKFSTCIHEHKKVKRRKKKYERFDSVLLPLPLYEGERVKSCVSVADKQLRDLMKEKHIPTSYVEETEIEVLKREYYNLGMPSSKKSYSVHKQQKEKDVEFIKGFLWLNVDLLHLFPHFVITSSRKSKKEKETRCTSC